MHPRTLVSISLLLAACGASGPSNGGETAPAAKHQSAHHHGHGSGAEGMHGNHRFEKADEWVNRFEGPERDAWQRPALVVESMSIEQGMVVADIGAGTGYFLPYLAAAVGPGGQSLGLDIEPDMVRYMRERIDREAIQGASAQTCAPDAPGLRAASTDRILIVDTWHHIEGRPAYAAKLRAALKPGGALYIVDFTQDSPHGPRKDHRLSAEAVIAELAEGGLKAERIEVDLPYQWVVKATIAP